MWCVAISRIYTKCINAAIKMISSMTSTPYANLDLDFYLNHSELFVCVRIFVPNALVLVVKIQRNEEFILIQPCCRDDHWVPFSSYSGSKFGMKPTRLYNLQQQI